MAKRVPEVITCKAVVCWGLGEPVKLEEIQVEPPKASEVRIKVLNASVCHTDVICIDGFPAPLFPRVLGHEGVGKVESVGEGVKDLKEGDLVVPTFIGECRECENCVSGKSNLCLKYPVPMSGLMYDGTSRMSINGQKLYHVFSCATWSEYAVVDTSYVVKVDPTMALSRASFVSCGFTTGFGAAWKTAGIEEGSTVAVIGLGAVGLGAIEGARIRGAAKVIGVDINEKKKTKGEVFGVTDFINPKESEKPMFELIKDLTGGMGVDYCFECTGRPTSVNQALLATKMGKGEAFVIGAGLQKTVEVTFIPLLFGGNLKGCIFGGLKAKTDFPLVIEKGKTKEIHLDELMTLEVSLQDINKAFEMLKQPDCLKILIKL